MGKLYIHEYYLIMHNIFAPFTFGLRCVYGARKLPVTPFPCGLRAEVATAVPLSSGFTGSAASTILYKNVIQV